jgi:hypothetical protein
MSIYTGRDFPRLPGNRPIQRVPVLVIVILIFAITAKTGWSLPDVTATMAVTWALAQSPAVRHRTIR